MTTNRWQAGNRITLRATDGFSIGDWQFEFGDHDDLHLTLRQQSPDEVLEGELLVVGGRLLLTKGLELPPGAEIDAIDGPGIMLKLVIELLGRAVPAGPEAFVHEAPVDIRGDEDLRVATQSASGEWPGPWHLEGRVDRSDAAIRFALTFTSPDSRLEFSGTWEQIDPPPQLDEGMSLAGWRIHSLGPRQDGATVDYGTSPIDVDATTLAGLRASNI
jgi:hypothetical protein